MCGEDRPNRENDETKSKTLPGTIENTKGESLDLLLLVLAHEKIILMQLYVPGLSKHLFEQFLN
jgi:hypothetical protein